MSKTDTVARLVWFSREKFIVRRTVQSREFLSKTGRSLFVVEEHDAVRRAWKGECTGHRQVSAWCAHAWCAAVL